MPRSCPCLRRPGREPGLSPSASWDQAAGVAVAVLEGGVLARGVRLGAHPEVSVEAMPEAWTSTL